jgi:thymidylate synthase ThyX
MTENPYLFEKDKQLVLTEAGLSYLSDIVTDPTGPVYVFTSKADRVLVAAAMARLSRSALDLRINFLREFAVAGPEQAEALFRRVITEYGDDSVKQLLTLACVVEGASNLLTKKLEWGRLAAYLEQSTRYIFFDEKIDGKYRYYTPELSPKVRDIYDHTMNKIFKTYSSMVRGITAYLRTKNPEPSDPKERQAWLNTTRATACDAVRAVLPAATTSTVGIEASAQSLEKLIWLLSAGELQEYREVGLKLLGEVRKVAAPFFERTDMPERGGYMVKYAEDIRAAMTRQGRNIVDSSWDGYQVRLLDYWPDSEDDLIAEMLFPYTSVSVEIIKNQLAYWGDEKKRAVFRDYMGRRLNRRNKPGRALEKLHYEWEIVGDYGTFRDLQRHRMVDMWEWQKLSPHYGYEVPPLVDEAGFLGQFDDCFVRSQLLYYIMRNEGYEEEAQYATLLGHKMRYRFMMNVREAFHMHELRTGPDGHPGYRKIVLEMHRLLSGVHPNIAAAMQFVNTREDPLLTRMASELATQAKLALLL